MAKDWRKVAVTAVYFAVGAMAAYAMYIVWVIVTRYEIGFGG